MKVVIGIVVVLAGAIGLGVLLNSGIQSAASPAANGTVYTLSEISTHHTKADCWLAIEGKVYDVTDFIPHHPGGNQMIQGCGKDATDLFTGKSALGRAHSTVARAMLNGYYIGDLKS